MSEKQDYNALLNYCRNATQEDECISECQSANFLAGHLAALIQECQQRGYIDEQGFLREHSHCH